MFYSRKLLGVFLIALLGAAGCSRSSGVSADAQPDRKTAHAAPADPQPDRKTGHAVAPVPQPDPKSGHGHGPSAHAAPEHKAGHPVAADGKAERPSGTGIGEVRSVKNTPNGKNATIEVLQPGEEKPRSYFVNHVPERKGPDPEVLATVRAAQVGDRVRFEWVQTNHGPAITKFSSSQFRAVGVQLI
jgi:hypothetical protein